MSRFSSVALLALALAACADAPELVIESPKWTLSREPAVAIGGDDQRAGYLVQMVVDATMLSDGRIVVADGGASEVRYYNPSGTHIVTATRPGRGPGELRGLIDIARLAGDTLAVLSYEPGITYLDPQGQYLRTQAFNLWELPGPCHSAEGSTYLLTDGTLLLIAETGAGRPGCAPSVEGVHRFDALVLRYDPSTQVLDTIAELPGTERNNFDFRVMGASLLAASSPDRLFLADTHADSIEVYDSDGQRLDRLRSPFPARPVPASAKVERLRRWEARDGSVEAHFPYEYPERLPHAARIRADPSGHLWVAAFPEPRGVLYSGLLDRALAPQGFDNGFTWQILDRSGVSRGTLQTPPRHFVFEVGEDYTLGVSWGDFDVQRVELYAVKRAAS